MNSVAHTAAFLAHRIRTKHADALKAITAVSHHPRSLARPIASWRPPQRGLPRVDGFPPLVVAITRYRVGPRARVELHSFGEQRTPAYLMQIRLTNPLGAPVDIVHAEGWVRALINADLVDAVHEIPSGSATTFIWLVDADFIPIPSPAELFSGLGKVA